MRYRDRERNRNSQDPKGQRDHRERRDPRDDRSQGGQDAQSRRNRFRRRRRRDFPRRPPREERKDWPPCPLCERPVSDLTSAITHMETGKPAHFDCIMKNIEQAEGGLASNEKICYLGKGSFGILRFQKIGGNIPFIIMKRIQYENIEETPEWRKQLDKYSARAKPPSPV